jgi:lysophospholipase L1-like esterase
MNPAPYGAKCRAGIAKVALAALSLLLFWGIPELVLRLGGFTFYLYNPYDPRASRPPPLRPEGDEPEREVTGGRLLDPARKLVPGRHVMLRFPKFRGMPDTWEANVNRRGFRGRDFTDAPASDTLRVVCLGDSSTFGLNVEDGDTYPRQLERILRRRHGDMAFEVINAGVPGYNSSDGRALLGEALAWKPAAVTIAYGVNDAWGIGDRAGERPGNGSAVARLDGWFDRFEAYRLLRYFTWLGKARAAKAGVIDWPDRGLGPILSPTDTETNLRRMAERIRAAGADAIFIDLGFVRGWRSEQIAAAARKSGAPLLDARARFNERRAREAPESIERSDARDLGEGEVEIQFRVRVPEDVRPPIEARVMPVLRNAEFSTEFPTLGLERNIPLRDDGQGCDVVANDGIWSECLRVERAEPLFYIFHGAAGYEFGTMHPLIQLHRFILRELQVEEAISRGDLLPAGEGRWALPVEPFGRRRLLNDSAHPNREGQAIIAESLADLIEGLASFRALASVRPTTSASALR